MSSRVAGLALALGLVMGGMAGAAPLLLQPADPQPSNLKPGLNVQYAYPSDVKTLSNAKAALKRSKPGPALSGLDYRDTDIGEKVLTSERAERVAAEITGYVKIDKPGVHVIDFLVNDGMRATVGGQIVGEFNGRQPCEETFAVEVEAPKAGWYPLHLIYYQRTRTACLHMRMGAAGKRVTWMPDEAFGR